MRHKNIAVLMTALDTDGQADMLKGIEEFGKEHGCNIAVFLWFTGAFEKDKHNLGELNIINLPDFNLFDGVILFSNTLHMENNRKKIEALLEDVTCPIVCIGCKLKDYVHIASDNYTAMRELIEHYVLDHKMQKIHFVKGVEGNEDAQARFQAYVDVLTENHIPVIPERISQGDFYVTGAARAAKEILNSSLPFPEAIVCANDVMAITICDILTDKGYRVPEDVAISGYDYVLEGQNHFPRLTTVRTRFKEIGVVACKTLLELVDGLETEKEIYLPDEVVLEESCGHTQSETDEELRERFYSSVNSVAFGGNIADYMEKVKEIDGVGAVKVIPVWNGGGTVKLIILDNSYNSASDILIENVQNAVGHEGDGIAPIGHMVTTVAAENFEITINTTITLQEGFEISVVKTAIEKVINDYFTEVKKEWENSTTLTVRIAHIESRMLDVNGVVDIANTTLNGSTSNLILTNEQIPLLSEVVLNA